MRCFNTFSGLDTAMNTSENINEIAKALSTAQAEMGNAQKNMTNTHFKNSYADLSEVINAVRPALSKAGIAFVQMTAIDGDAMVLHTRLIHTSGQWLESVHPIAKLPANAQAIGAGETYARRYSLAAICGIGQEDDDLADGKSAPVPPALVDQVAIAKSANIRDMLIAALHNAKTIAELEEWRLDSKTKSAAASLHPADKEKLTEAGAAKRSDLNALDQEDPE